MKTQPIKTFEFVVAITSEEPKKVEIPSITALSNHLQYLIDHQAGSWIGQDWVPEQYYNPQLDYSIKELENFFKTQANVIAKCKETQVKLEKLYSDLCREIEEEKEEKEFKIGDRVIRNCPPVDIGPYSIMNGEIGTIVAISPNVNNCYRVIWDRFPKFKCSYSKNHLLKYGGGR
jgi:hypothetical protein